MTIEFIQTGVVQGLILSLVAFAVMVPYTLLNKPDLSAEGAYPLGGAICASCMLMELGPVTSLIIAAIGCAFFGICVAYIHLRLAINSLLAGIILSTMAYSINLRILSASNVSLFQTSGLFDFILGYDGLILGGVVATVVGGFYLYLNSYAGLRLRAVGYNPSFAKRHSISVISYTVFGFAFASCLSGLAGGLIVQLQRYMDVGIGVGIVIHALAALMIGEAVCRAPQSILRQLLSPVVGALIYQQIQGVALSLGLAPSDLKFFTGLIVLIVLFIRKSK